MKKTLFITILAIIMMVGLCGIAYAADPCDNCSNNSHGGCRNGTYNKYYDSTWHVAYCRCCDAQIQGGNSKHSWSTTSTTAATCTTDGSKTESCSGCNSTNTTTIAKLGHNNQIEYKSGYTDGQCYRYECQRSGCGYTGSWTGHNMSSSVTTAATCISDGVRTYQCSRITGHKYTETIPKTGHSYGNWTITSTSTCQTKGSRVRTCSVCGASDSESLALVSHSYTEKLKSSATCTEAAVYYEECIWCATQTPTYTKGNPLGHDPGPAATCTEPQKCNRCGVTLANALQHDAGAAATCTTEQKCNRCSVVLVPALGHDYTKACPKCSTANIVCSRNSSHTVSHDCSIYVTPPTVSSIHRWTGYTIRAVAEHSSGYYTLSGSPTAKDIGSYTAVATLKSGTEPTYRWSDTRGTEQKTYNWMILDVATEKVHIIGPEDVQVKTGEVATFAVSPSAGTNIRYQWYYNTSNSTTGGTMIPTATSSTYSVTVDKNMNNRYYYCVLSNNSSSPTSLTSTASRAALLTVWWPHEISAHPVDNLKIKAGETASFSVTATGGNPSTYNYQWYSVSTPSGGTGNAIAGATSGTYSLVPTQNVSGIWYYCEVNNGQYNIPSNRAKLVADVTIPKINTGVASKAYANKNVTFTVPITITDTGEGFDIASFEASDIIVKVNGATVSPTVKNLNYGKTNGDYYEYTLELSGVTGDGVLALEVNAGTIKDNFGNVNTVTYMPVSGILIDNTSPVIQLNGEVTGTNQKYINSEDVIQVPLKITDAGGINPSVFTASDILVKVDGTVNPNVKIEEVKYNEKTGNDYSYTVVIKGITGNGAVSLEIVENSIEDFATNLNVATAISNLNVIVDNIKPQVVEVVLSLGGYSNTSRLYPESLLASNESWVNENVFAVINATDELSGVETYWHSLNDASNFVNIGGKMETWEADMNNKVLYRVIDFAGNVSDPKEVLIKIETVPPVAAELDMRLNRENGVPYEYDSAIATSKSIYVIPDETYDTGTYQSGVWKTEYKITFNDGVTTTTTELIDGKTGTLLKETGTYIIEVITTDRAGNVSNPTNFFNAIISKETENTVKIENIHDEGAGVQKVTIMAKKSGTTEYNAIEPIVIENPPANINQRIQLSDGTYIIRAELIDKVGNLKVLETTITNEL